MFKLTRRKALGVLGGFLAGTVFPSSLQGKFQVKRKKKLSASPSQKREWLRPVNYNPQHRPEYPDDHGRSIQS